jgi:hypothetical protein
MFVFSRVVVGLARQKKELERVEMNCTYNSILDFYVLSVNWVKAGLAGGGVGGWVIKIFGGADAAIASRLAPTWICGGHKTCGSQPAGDD